jgi:hypothetical protein
MAKGTSNKSADSSSVMPAPMTCAQFQEFVSEINAAEREWKEAHDEAKTFKSRVDALKKKFKKAGGHLDELKDALRLQKMGEDDASAYVSAVLRYSKWLGMPIGAQSSIFDVVDEPPLTTSQQDRAIEIQQEETGELRGLEGDDPDDNPHQPGEIAYVAWERGRKKGFAKFAAKQAGEKPTRKPRGAAKGAAAPPPAPVVGNATASPLN